MRHPGHRRILLGGRIHQHQPRRRLRLGACVAFFDDAVRGGCGPPSQRGSCGCRRRDPPDVSRARRRADAVPRRARHVRRAGRTHRRRRRTPVRRQWRKLPLLRRRSGRRRAFSQDPRVRWHRGSQRCGGGARDAVHAADRDRRVARMGSDGCRLSRDGGRRHAPDRIEQRPGDHGLRGPRQGHRANARSGRPAALLPS